MRPDSVSATRGDRVKKHGSNFFFKLFDMFTETLLRNVGKAGRLGKIERLCSKEEHFIGSLHGPPSFPFLFYHRFYPVVYVGTFCFT